MPDSGIGRSMFYLAEIDHLRQEAIELFEEGLTSGNDARLLEFIENQIVHEPPRLALLRDMADDLQQRLLSLREYHFDVRDRVVRTLSESYDVNIASIAPPNQLDHYHELTAAVIVAYVRQYGAVNEQEELPLVQKMVEASLSIATQLHNDIQMTTRLHEFITDWIEGMSATVARQYWTSHYPVQPSEAAHEQNLSH